MPIPATMSSPMIELFEAISTAPDKNKLNMFNRWLAVVGAGAADPWGRAPAAGSGLQIAKPVRSCRLPRPASVPASGPSGWLSGPGGSWSVAATTIWA
jgi:hypothetical protein